MVKGILILLLILFNMALSICSMLIHFRNMLSVLNTKALPFSQIQDYAYRNITNSAVMKEL